ncbi:hypothetical protein KP509_30G050300 [Ceratopteris richardii]|uniref:rRNA adenine N(6)-methyltransferase n=1 Tax=Ceratopteris richardii TaxID=49495 RepID=A0A8T2R4M5_CERRI|nr:hypothetical protein KP509_30G050300 [Ceratopteris richardii]
MLKNHHESLSEYYQHYMVNNEINEKLVECANIQKGDIVLEIGPGTGSLTNSLVEAGAHVIAVEKDPAMAELIMERFQDSGLVEVVNEDFMKWRIRTSIEYFRNHYSAKGIPFKQIKVVSNLPFNITTPVVKRILPMGDIFSSMVLLLQDEAAYRLIDMSPQASNYRSISLFVQFFSVAQYEMKVSRSNFFPRPNVDGAIISFNIKSALDYPSVSSTKSFFTLVNMAFAEKRKMLRNSLEHKHPPAKIRNALKSVNLDETARPAELTLDQFVALYNALDASKENHPVDCT